MHYSVSQIVQEFFKNTLQLIIIEIPYLLNMKILLDCFYIQRGRQADKYRADNLLTTNYSLLTCVIELRHGSHFFQKHKNILWHSGSKTYLTIKQL